MYHDLSFKASQLQAKNQTTMATATAVLLAALFVTAILPSLLIQYVYAGQQLLAQPVLLEYIPVVSFVVGLGYFLFAVVSNTMRAKRIKFLEEQAEVEGYEDEDDDDYDDEEILAELESLTGSLVEEKKPAKKKKTAPKKSPAKKAKK